jgi:hypothetical protein
MLLEKLSLHRFLALRRYFHDARHADTSCGSAPGDATLDNKTYLDCRSIPGTNEKKKKIKEAKPWPLEELLDFIPSISAKSCKRTEGRHVSCTRDNLVDFCP